MALTDKQAASEFLCPEYQSVGENTKKCRYFRPGSACELTAHPCCEEWLRRNPNGTPKDPKAAEFIRKNPDYVLAVCDAVYFRPGWKARILDRLDGTDGVQTRAESSHSGVPVPASPSQAREKRTESPATALESPTPTAEPREAVKGTQGVSGVLTEGDVESFKALGVSVCMTSPTLGEVWLVPSYTGDRSRHEITPEHALTLCRITNAFPGAKVSQFLTPPNPPMGIDPDSKG